MTNLQRVVSLACFNPPPALSARGTSGNGPYTTYNLFQSTPRFVGEGNLLRAFG